MAVATGLALLALALWVIPDDADEAPAHVRIPSGYYGVAGHVLRQMANEGRFRQLDDHVAAIERLGISFVRANVDWPQIEPRPPAGGHDYDFGVLDTWVATLARHGLRWYAVGVGTPTWAGDARALATGCSTLSPPARAADFAAVMAAVADRYGRDGTFWAERPELTYRPVVEYEVWNEPNLGGFWCPAPEPARYAELVLAASGAIHTVDSDAQVIFGGLAPSGSDQTATDQGRAAMGAADFLATAVASRDELRGAIELLGAHAYGSPEAILRQVRGYRLAAERAGLASVPLSVNESGWTTNGTGSFAVVTEEQRARLMAQVAREITTSDCRVASFAPHSWVTEEADVTDQEDWFGIADPASGRPYRTALAYGDVIAGLPPGTELASEGLDAVCGG